jgi:DNA-binding PadR family transcriptional regulator
VALAQVVLGLVAGGVRHGYAIWRRIDDVHGARGRVQRSHVHAALAALERRGLVVAALPGPPVGRRRRTFDTTSAGRESLRAWLACEPSDAVLVLQRTLLMKCALRARLGERPARRLITAERGARLVVIDRAEPCETFSPDGDALGRLLRERARRHADVELWLLDRLGVEPARATRSRPGSASR